MDALHAHCDRCLLDDRARRAAPATTRARTPNGSVMRGAVGVAGRKAEQHRTGKVGQQVGHRPRAPSAAPPGSSQRGSSPKTIADGARRAARLAAAASACDRAGTAARRLRRGTARSPAADRTRTACRATPAAASACRREHAGALRPARSDLEPADAQLAQRLARGRAPRRTSRDRSPPRRARAGPRASARETRRCRSRVVSHVEERRVVAVADERLAARARISPRSSSGSSCALP